MNVHPTDWRKRSVASLVALVSLLSSAPLRGQGNPPLPSGIPPAPPASIALPPLPSPALVPIPSGTNVIEPLQQGQPAPFTGQLFDLKTALRWGNFLEQCRVRLDVDVRTERDRGIVEAGYWRTRLEQDRASFLVIVQDQQNQIAKLSIPKAVPFYQEGWFTFGLGAVSTGVLIGLGVYAAHTAK